MQEDIHLHLPQITKLNAVIKGPEDELEMPFYTEVIYKILGQTIPVDLFKKTEEEFDSELPILKNKICSDAPGNLTIYAFCKYHKHSLKFFIEMLSNWLLPSQRLNLAMVFSSVFCIPSIGSSTYMVCEVVIHVSSQFDLDQVRINLPIIESEICLGMESFFYAKRILEIKGLTIDAKTAIIQEKIAYLLERKPQYFDSDMLNEMQHVLVICRDEFKIQRSIRHLSRIIGIQYFFRKSLSGKSQVPNKRYVFLKIFRSELQIQTQKKHVLGIIVGFNFLREKEVFEKRVLIRAIQEHIPNASIVENSFFEDRRSLEHFYTMYLEIEKSTGEKFSNDEIENLRKILPGDLLDGIERLVHSVFMPRNEEEIMRNILSLSAEIKYLQDLPQVMIIFDDQTYTKLAFTVFIVRVPKPGEDSIQNLFSRKKTLLDFVHDRCRTIGYLRNKYVKEANVCSVKIDKDDFIRRGQTIDLNKARQVIVAELIKVIGEFRDFNGGLIAKQNELLSDVKLLMASEAKYNELLLENFFFAVTPLVTVLEPQALKRWFLMLQETIVTVPEPEKNYFVNMEIKAAYVFAVIKSEKRLNHDEIAGALNVLQVSSSDIATAYIQINDVNYNCYIFHCLDPIRQEQFGSIIHHLVSRMFKVKEKALPVSS